MPQMCRPLARSAGIYLLPPPQRNSALTFAAAPCSRRRRRRPTQREQELAELLGNIVCGGGEAGEAIGMLERHFAGELDSDDEGAISGALEPLRTLLATATTSSAPPTPARDSDGASSDGGMAGGAAGAAGSGAGSSSIGGGGGGGGGSSSSSSSSSSTEALVSSGSSGSSGGDGRFWKRKVWERWPHSMDGGIAQKAVMPPHPPFTSHHCPPLAKLPPQLACNCMTLHNLPCCCLEPGGLLTAFAERELTTVRAVVDEADRPPNNALRYRCYCETFYTIHTTVATKGLRVPCRSVLLALSGGRGRKHLAFTQVSKRTSTATISRFKVFFNNKVATVIINWCFLRYNV